VVAVQYIKNVIIKSHAFARKGIGVSIGGLSKRAEINYSQA
jgi:hypothetical protein